MTPKPTGTPTVMTPCAAENLGLDADLKYGYAALNLEDIVFNISTGTIIEVADGHTAGGIVGKITAVYPTASMVLLASDPLFAAGVVSQKHRAQGTLKGQGTAKPATSANSTPA